MSLNPGVVCATVFAVLFAALAISPGGADAKIVRTMSLNDGINTAQFKVPHRTKSLPPAIVYSTSPADLKCAAVDYRYGARETRGRMKISIRCQDTPKNASAKLVFRAPYVRQFPLRNGTSRIRIRADKPRGTTRPLGSLTTIPRNTNCDVSPTGTKTGPKQSTATAKISCKDLPDGAKGIFGLGGLVSEGQLDKPGTAAAVTSSYQGATTSGLSDFIDRFRAGNYGPDKCDPEKTLDLKGQKTFRWKTCYSVSFVLGPWESERVGFGTPNGQCEGGWNRNFTVTEAPGQWLFSNFSVSMWTEPDTRWYGWSWGLVTNWQINENIEFRFQWNCYRIG